MKPAETPQKTYGEVLDRFGERLSEVVAEADFAAACIKCGQCVQVCRFDAIVQVGPSCDFGGAS